MKPDNYRSVEMHKKNRLRALKTIAVLDVIRWIDEGTFPKNMFLKVPKLMSDLPDVNDKNWMPMDGESLHLLQGNLNSYRAQLIAHLIGINIDKAKLLSFAKAKGYVYSLDTQAVLKLCKDVLFTIKIAVVIHYHNLKVTEFDSLVGVFVNANKVGTTYGWVASINNVDDIFTLDPASKDGFISNL